MAKFNHSGKKFYPSAFLKAKNTPICSLCKRNRPLLLEELKRLPYEGLNSFLKQLKADQIQKMRYLTKLRITPKFVQACKCTTHGNMVHSYCKAVQIIQTKRISCDKCGYYYEFNLSKKKVSLLTMLCNTTFYTFLTYLAIYAVFCFEGRFKCNGSRSEAYKKRLDLLSENSFPEQFALFNEICVPFNSMVRIMIIVLMIILWSTYYEIIRLKTSVSELTLVELLPYDTCKVTRKQAKQNLHTILEHNAKKKIPNKMFD